MKWIFFIFLYSCGHPLDSLEDFLKSFGYILHKTPMISAYTGTLVGGRPNQMAFVAPPETCFPSEINFLNTELRKKDITTLPNITESFTLEASVFTDFLNSTLIAGAPSISFKLNSDIVSKVSINFEQPFIEYMNEIKLFEFYHSQLGENCKKFLNKFPFIIQALGIEKLSFKFFTKKDVSVQLSAAAIQNVLGLRTKAAWKVENEYTLNIESPKIIGYQLARLNETDKGISLLRSSRTKRNKWVFEKINIWEESIENFSKQSLQKWDTSIILENLEGSLDVFEDASIMMPQ